MRSAMLSSYKQLFVREIDGVPQGVHCIERMRVVLGEIQEVCTCLSMQGFTPAERSRAYDIDTSRDKASKDRDGDSSSIFDNR